MSLACASVERGFRRERDDLMPRRFSVSSNSSNSSVSPLVEIESTTSSADQHPEIAVGRFRRMQKQRRRAGAGKCRRNFSADQP